MNLHGRKSSLENLRQNYDRALNSNPMNVDAYWRRGEARYLLKDYQGALADYSRALQLVPDAKGYLKRAFLYVAVHNFQDVLQDYNHALQLNPRDSDVYLSRARVRRNYQVQDYQGAIEDYKRVLSLQPQAVGIYSILGEIQDMNGDRQQAILNFSKVIRFNPNDGQAYHHRAHLSFQLGNYRNAIQDFNQALHFEPDVYSLDYVQRGISRHQLGDYRGAIGDFDRYIATYNAAMRLDPNFTEIKDAYSLRRQAQQRLDKPKHLPFNKPQK